MRPPLRRMEKVRAPSPSPLVLSLALWRARLDLSRRGGIRSAQAAHFAPRAARAIRKPDPAAAGRGGEPAPAVVIPVCADRLRFGTGALPDVQVPGQALCAAAL